MLNIRKKRTKFVNAIPINLLLLIIVEIRVKTLTKDEAVESFIVENVSFVAASNVSRRSASSAMNNDVLNAVRVYC